jgi:hypothetical protein
MDGKHYGMLWLYWIPPESWTKIKLAGIDAKGMLGVRDKINGIWVLFVKSPGGNNYQSQNQTGVRSSHHNFRN